MTNPQQSEFWKTLIPGLSIEGPKSLIEPIFHTKQNLVRIADHLQTQGYIYEQPLISKEILDPLRDGILALDQAGFPPVFIYLYDEAWNLFAKLSPLISYFLGDNFRLLPNFWAWNIPLNEGAAGWPPHRDCQAETRFKIGGKEEILMSLSLWIPLSDATKNNGCMYVLPRSSEDNYDPPLKEAAQINMDDAKALPAISGSVLGWPQDLFHWSGRVTRHAINPRISMSLEFQNPAFTPLIEPLLDIHHPPVFSKRLELIKTQFPKYKHMENLNFNLD